MAVPSLLSPALAAAYQPVAVALGESVMPGESVSPLYLPHDQLRRVPAMVSLQHDNPEAVLRVPAIEDGKVVSRPFEDFRQDPQRWEWMVRSLVGSVARLGSPYNHYRGPRYHLFLGTKVGTPIKSMTADIANEELIMGDQVRWAPGIMMHRAGIRMEAPQVYDAISFGAELVGDGKILTTMSHMTNAFDVELDSLSLPREVLEKIGGAFFLELAGELPNRREEDKEDRRTFKARKTIGDWQLHLQMNGGELKIQALYTGTSVAGLTQLFGPHDFGACLFVGDVAFDMP